MGLVEPINSRITDPRYFLNTPHQGTALPKAPAWGKRQPWLLSEHRGRRLTLKKP